MGFYPASGAQSVNGNLVVNGTITSTGGATIGGSTSVAGNLSTSDLGTVTASGGFLGQLGGLDVQFAGAGLKIKEGSNAKQGTATLAAGTVTVADTSVTANSRIFLTPQTSSGSNGALYVSGVTAGTSFTVTSTNASDTATFAYEIFEPG